MFGLYNGAFVYSDNDGDIDTEVINIEWYYKNMLASFSDDDNDDDA